MLECNGISVAYGQHQALEDVAIRISPGEIVVILGANGAGKSTLLKAIAGLVPMTGGGQVRVDGRSVTGFPPHRIVETGVVLVPEDRRLFGELTVEENLLLGAYAERARKNEREHLEQVLSLFPRLAERKRQIARTLSGGEQQMVAVGRAMMSAPSILMLDEPSLGLSPLVCGELFHNLVEIRKTGVGILLVEQNARQALAIAERGYLLENGHIVGEDSAENLTRDTKVQEAYLGGAGGHAAPAPPAPSPVSGRAGTSGPAPISSQGAAMATSENGDTDGRIQPRGMPRRVPTDQLIQGSVSELVHRAEERQAEHVRSRRNAEGVRPSAAPAPPPAAQPQAAAPRTPPPTYREGTSLEDALARIKAAAANARRGGRG